MSIAAVSNYSAGNQQTAFPALFDRANVDHVTYFTQLSAYLANSCDPSMSRKALCDLLQQYKYAVTLSLHAIIELSNREQGTRKELLNTEKRHRVSMNKEKMRHAQLRDELRANVAKSHDMRKYHEQFVRDNNTQWRLKIEDIERQASNREEERVEALERNHQRCVTGMSQDINDLHNIHNEELDRVQGGLPPPYGSIDTRVNQPPWRYHDAGMISDLANIKRVARNDFVFALKKSVNAAMELRNSSKPAERRSAGPIFFFMVSESISELSRNLLRLIDDFADDRMSASGSSVLDANSTLNIKDGVPVAISPRATVASAGVNLIMEFCWQVFGFLRARGMSIKAAKRRSRVLIALTWVSIDEKLCNIIRHSISGYTQSDALFPGKQYRSSVICGHCERSCLGACVRLNRLGQFDAVVASVHDMITQLTDDDTFLEHSRQWIAENIETERRNAFNAAER